MRSMRAHDIYIRPSRVARGGAATGACKQIGSNDAAICQIVRAAQRAAVYIRTQSRLVADPRPVCVRRNMRSVLDSPETIGLCTYVRIYTFAAADLHIRRCFYVSAGLVSLARLNR